MAGIARAMKRHGLTAKPELRLVDTTRSGDTDYYMFEISGSGRHYTVAKPDFWRGGGTSPVDPYPEFRKRAIVVDATPADTDRMADALQPAVVAGGAAYQAALAAPTPAAPATVEHIRVRDMKVGDVVTAVNAKKGAPREILRIEPGSPFYFLHYVREGELALRTSKHVPGAKFVLRKRAEVLP